MPGKRNHHADLKTSWRLQKVKAILDDGGWHSAVNIEDEFRAVGRRIAAVGSAMSELRSNDLKIETKYINGVWKYRLTTSSNGKTSGFGHDNAGSSPAVVSTDEHGQVDFLQTSMHGQAKVR